MSNLLQYLKEVKTKKLKQYEDELDEEFQRKIGSLEGQYNNLVKAIEHEEKTHEQQLMAQQEFYITQEVDFFIQQYQIEHVKKLWQAVVTEYFSQGDNLTRWLQQNVQHLEKAEKAVVSVGKSRSVVEPLLQSNADITVQAADQLAQEEGFLYESESFVIDATLSTYLEDLFVEHEEEIFRLVFAQ